MGTVSLLQCERIPTRLAMTTVTKFELQALGSQQRLNQQQQKNGMRQRNMQ